jgi:shikimate kinase
LAADPTTASRRPALAGGDPLDEVAGALSVREPFYREVADVAFDTASDEPAVVAERILTWLGSEAPEGAA